jgi:hypothetical protein
VARRLYFGLALFALTMVYVVASRFSPFFYVDDAYISFRYAENLAAGQGLVYNFGERVEGYSTTLFVLLLAAFGRLFGWIPSGATVFGLIFHAATIVLTAAFLLRFVTKRLIAPWPLFALAFLTFHPTGVGYAESGMETSLASCLAIAAVYWAAVAAEGPRSRSFGALTGLAVFLMALTRPEMLVWAAPIGLWLLLGRREDRWRRIIPFAAVFVVGYGSFLLWRHWYFGEWQPNTYYAKVAGAGASLVTKGLVYLWRYSITALFPLVLPPLALLAVGTRRALPRWFGWLAAIAVTHTAAVVWLGGDHFPLSRFFVPLTPVLLVLLVQSGEVLAAHWAGAVQRGLAWAGAAVLLVGAVTLGMVYPNSGIIFIRMGVLASNWCGIGDELARRYTPDVSLALIPIGAVGYCSKLPIVDLVGLTDKTIARALPGHGRYYGRYVLEEKKPELVLLTVRRLPWPLPEWALQRGLYQPADLDLIEQPAFARDYAFHRLSMGGEYLHYYSRRDFEDPAFNPGTYPVPGADNPLPAQEPPPDFDLRGALMKHVAQRPGGAPLNWWEVW